MKKRADHEPGYVLHTYPYKETSLIVEAFTRRYGRVALLARGARRPRSAMRGILLAFHPLRLGWSGSAELSNLMQAEWGGALQPLAGRYLRPRTVPARARLYHRLRGFAEPGQGRSGPADLRGSRAGAHHGRDLRTLRRRRPGRAYGYCAARKASASRG